jgi:hypothetical protein
MRFPLDVVFLDADGVPLALEPSVGPRQVLRRMSAAAVLEVPA